MTLIAGLLALLGLLGCGDDVATDPDPADTGVADAGDDALGSDARASDAGASDAAPDGDMADAAGPPVTVTLLNHGGSMEGHTPRGFAGMGAGLFTGDNLNPSFPEGDGVQLFLTFDLSTLPAGTIDGAVLSSSHGGTTGTPFADLGELRAEEVRYETFSPALFDLEPVVGGGSCVFATSAAGPFSCDLTAVVEAARAEGRSFAQLRLRLDLAGDSDGSADLVTFFITNSNTNEPGIFELAVTVAP